MSEKDKKNRKAFVATSDLLAETIYTPGKTAFAVWENGEARCEDVLQTETGEIFPLDPRSDIVSKGVVLLPTRPIEYEDDEKLLGEIVRYIHKRCDISPQFELIAAHYVLMSWIFDRLNELPYLRVRGDYGSGKSRFLRVVGSICYRPIFTAGATTTAPIFRIVDQVRGTLVLDEADFNKSDERSEIVKILNTGYQKGVPVLRCEGKGIFDVKSYDVYGPKIVATRQNFDDQALESRFLIEDMGRPKLRADIPIRLDDSSRDEARELRNKLLMWRFHNYHKPLQFDDKPLEGLQPRLQQIIIPLLAIMPSPDLKETLIAHARRYNAELIADRGLSWETEVVLAVLRLEERNQVIELTVKEIATEVNSEMEIGENLSARKTGWILRSKMLLKAQRTNRGYVLSLTKNRERLDYWRDRLGITDGDIKGEEVSDVNVQSSVIAEITREDSPF